MKDNLNECKFSTKKISYKVKLLFLSVIVGFLFYKFAFNYGGVSVCIFTSILILGFIFINGIKVRSCIGIFFMIVNVLLSISYAIYTNPIFRFLNKMLIPITLISSFLLVTYNDIDFQFTKFTKEILDRVFKVAIPNIRKVPVSITKVIKTENKNQRNDKIKNILNGVVISIPVLLFLCILLSNADSVFGHYMKSIVLNINSKNVFTVLAKLLISFGTSVFIFSLYDSFSMKLQKNYVKNTESSIEGKGLNSIMVITILMFVSVLYLLFTKVQICYLYGGKTLPEGFTYSEYARSGFFQLVFIVLLNLISVILIKKNTGYNNNIENKLLVGLYSIITILTFNMAFSALYKMRLYIRVFGFTRLRILVSIFTVFLVFILIVLLIFIWKNINLFKPIIIFGAIIYVGVNFFNIDEFITRNNLRLSSYSKNIDKYYLSTLSFDNYNSITEAYKQGKISIEEYNSWIEINKEEVNHWYEYNYYCFKGNSIRR